MELDVIEMLHGYLVEVRLDVVSCVDTVHGLGEGMLEVLPMRELGISVGTFCLFC